MPLTPKQAAFVAEYTKDQNGTRSAIAAGYAQSSAHVTAYDLLRHPKIKAALEAVQTAAIHVIEAKTEEAIGSAAWIIERAAEVVNRALNLVPVRDSKGNVVEGEWSCNIGAATPALALLARRHPEFSEKHDLNVNLRAQVIALVGEMDEEQLRAAKARLT